MVAAVVVVMFDSVEDTGVDGSETLSAGRQRMVEVGEAGCMLLGLKLARVEWMHKQVCRRLVADRKRML